MSQLSILNYPVCGRCEKGSWLPLNSLGHDFKAWGCNYCGAFMTTAFAEKDLHPTLVLVPGVNETVERRPAKSSGRAA